jgi:hypothetical protein
MIWYRYQVDGILPLHAHRLSMLHQKKQRHGHNISSVLASQR